MSVRDYQRIAQTIDFLASKSRSRPSRRALAAHIGLSESAFQHLFHRWAGVSLERFLHDITARQVRECLQTSACLLEADLASEGQSHNPCKVIQATSSGELKAGDQTLLIRYARHDTPFGPCLAAATPRGLCQLSFEDDPQASTALATLRHDWPHATLTEDPAPTANVLATLFIPTHQPAATRCTLHLTGTPFQFRVWAALLQIPPGALTTYTHIAHQLGQPGAARAVGNAIGANPVAWLIPCHRVIRQTGIIGGYRWGSTRKQAMLGWEAAHRANRPDQSKLMPSRCSERKRHQIQ